MNPPSRTPTNHLPDVSVRRSGEQEGGREGGEGGIISHLSGSRPRRRRQARETRERWEVWTTLFLLRSLLLFKEHVQTILRAVLQFSCETEKVAAKIYWSKNPQNTTVFISTFTCSPCNTSAVSVCAVFLWGWGILDHVYIYYNVCIKQLYQDNNCRITVNGWVRS